MAKLKNSRISNRKRKRKVSKKKVLDRIKQRRDRMLENLVVSKANSIRDLKIGSVFSVPIPLESKD